MFLFSLIFLFSLFSLYAYLQHFKVKLLDNTTILLLNSLAHSFGSKKTLCVCVCVCERERGFEPPMVSVKILIGFYVCGIQIQVDDKRLYR